MARHSLSFTSAWSALQESDPTLPIKERAQAMDRDYKVTPAGVASAMYNYWWICGGRREGSAFLGPIPIGFRQNIRSWRHAGPSCSEILTVLVEWTDTVLPEPPLPPLPHDARVWRSTWEEERREVQDKISDMEVWLWKWAVSDHRVVDGCLKRRKSEWVMRTSTKRGSTGQRSTYRHDRGHQHSVTTSSLAV